MPIIVEHIYRYPIKGLSPEPLQTVNLEAGECLPGDRAYALARPGAPFDASKPAHLPKTHFLMLMRDEALAALDTAFDDATKMLLISEGGVTRLEASVESDDGRAAITALFKPFLGSGAASAPDLAHAPGHTFSDKPAKVVSLINLASVDALSKVVGRTVDPLRFRANIYFRGAPAWAEFEWLGRKLMVGDCALAVIDRIPRCAATDVDPKTARRDMHIPKTLMDSYGHTDMGLYARVSDGGAFEIGDLIEVD